MKERKKVEKSSRSERNKDEKEQEPIYMPVV
jgi:hypothetical protein